MTLDTPLLALFVVGLTSPALISRHKRLQGFTAQDFDVLVTLIAESEELVLLAYTLAETSNWLGYTQDPDKTRVFVGFQAVIRMKREEAVPGRKTTERGEFLRLGVADSALLTLAERGTVVLTTDHDLYAATLGAGYSAINFNHLPHRI